MVTIIFIDANGKQNILQKVIGGWTLKHNGETYKKMEVAHGNKIVKGSLVFNREIEVRIREILEIVL